jgi:hypothetical protein
MEYNKIETIHDLLNWISHSSREEWKTADGLKERVNIAMVKIAAAKKEKLNINELIR